MKRFLLTLLFTLTTAVAALAQKGQHTVFGTVVNERDERPVELATVRLLTPDSTLVTGTFTDSLGHFTLHTDRSGNYIVHSSFVSFTPAATNVHVSALKDSIDAGTLRMQGDDIALRSAVITATASRVEQREDTTMYNATAYRIPDGATLEALIKQFPGIEVTDDGKIKWNGKEVKEFLVNGKDFFKGDTKVAMKNLPANLVSRVKAYDKRSDYAEQTGIDDGEESTVLDIMVKRELNQSFILNADLGGGWDWDTHGLYSGRFFATRFTDHARVTVLANANNVGDRGFGSARGGGGNNGIVTMTTVGTDVNWENGRKRYESGQFEIGGNAFYTRSNSETESTSSSETFMQGSTRRSFSNSHSWGTALSQSVNSSLRLQWSPDSLTAVSLRPSYSWSQNENNSRSRSAQFDENPFDGMRRDFPTGRFENTDDVLDRIFTMNPATGRVERTDYSPSWLVNTNNRLSLSYSTRQSANANLSVTRRLTGKAGRNINVEARGSWSKADDQSYALSDIYSRRQNADGTTSLTANGTHQYSKSPSIDWNTQVGGSYTEPLKGSWYGELRYTYNHRFQDTNRSLYDLHELTTTAEGLNGIINRYTGSDMVHLGQYHPATDGVGSVTDDRDVNTTELLNQLLTLNPADVMAAIRDEANSRYATYIYDTHRAGLGVRYNDKTVVFNAAVSVNPEHTALEYRKGDFETHSTRSVFTFSPNVRFRYNFSKTNRLDINYRGNSSQPSMTNLLPVADTSNPLAISAGNPDLAPSWSDNLRLFFNSYNTKRQAGLSVFGTMNLNRRNVTTRQITDEVTGVRYSRPENIDGNWSTNAGVTYNMGLGQQKLFTVSTSTNGSFSRNVGFSSAKGKGLDQQLGETTFDYMTRLFSQAMGSDKTVARNTNLSERLALTYRRAMWDVTADGRVNYLHSASDAMNAQNMNTWGFNYGLSGNVNLDCGLSLSTDIRMTSRRGYAEAAMNTNELIWNAQISQSFLKGRPLTLQLQFYDILRQQSNVSYNVTALARNDSWHSAINSYVMLHVIYRLSLFGGSHKEKAAQQGSSPFGSPNQGGYGPGGGRPGADRPAPGGAPMSRGVGGYPGRPGGW